MRRSFRHHVTLVALCAMMLRGLIPLGWMPGSSGAMLMTFCTANGPVVLQVPDNSAGFDDSHRNDGDDAGHELCAFAAAGSLGAPVTAGFVPVRYPLHTTPATEYTAPLLDFTPAHATNPRAPPAGLIHV